MAYGHKRCDLSLTNPEHLRRFEVRIWDSDGKIFLHSENALTGIMNVRLKVTDVQLVMAIVRKGMQIAGMPFTKLRFKSH